VVVHLKAPIHIDHEQVGHAKTITTIHTITGSIKEEELTLLEVGRDGLYFSNGYTIPQGTSRMEFSYGYGLFKKAAILYIINN